MRTTKNSSALSLLNRQYRMWQVCKRGVLRFRMEYWRCYERALWRDPGWTPNQWQDHANDNDTPPGRLIVGPWLNKSTPPAE